jgi:hypothetical protein
MTMMRLSSNRRRLGGVAVAAGWLVLGACNDHKPVAVVDDDAGSDASSTDGAMMTSEASVDASESGAAEGAAEAASDATSDGPSDAGTE